MAERGILMQDWGVRAILTGRKTQTRQVVTGKWLPLVEEVLRVNGKWVWSTVDYDLTTPYGQPGDVLWVRETWAYPLDYSTPDLQPDTSRVFYRADSDILAACNKWRPSIHMPRWASRLSLPLTAVRVERVQDMTDHDARAEGFADVYDFALWWYKRYADYGRNPYVWVLEWAPVEATR